jgi:hypothetical protein
VDYAVSRNFTPNENDYPLVVEFKASIEDVYVDPRDFLCTAFQRWDEKSAHQQQRQTKLLAELFGPAIERYFSAACASLDQSYRIAMCNLASFDEAVVESHYANNRLIAGRYKTRFSSAFFVKAPIQPERICYVCRPEPEPTAAIDVSLEDFLGRSRA